MKKPNLFIFAAFFLISLVLTYSLLEYFTPYIKEKIQSELIRQLNERTPYKAQIKEISISPLTLGIKFKEVKLMSQIQSPDIPQRISIEELDIGMSLYKLWQGKYRINHLRLIRPIVIIQNVSFGNSMQKSKNPFDWSQLDQRYVFELFNLFPFLEETKITIFNGELSLLWSESHTYLYLKDINWQIRFEKKLIQNKLEINDIFIQKGSTIVPLKLIVNLTINPEEINIDQIHLTGDESYLSFSGSYSNQTLKGNVTINVTLEKHLRSLIKELKPIDITGKINVTGALNHRFPKNLAQISGIIETSKLTLNQYVIGDTITQFSFEDNIVKITELKITNPKQKILISQAQISLADQWQSAKTHFKIVLEEFELQNLFRNLKLHKIPVWIDLTSQGHCEGILWPDFKINCDKKIEIRDLIVKADMKDKSNIIHISQLKVTGDVSISTQNVKYNGKAFLSNAGIIKSSGEIIYSEGFNITYEGENVDFQKIGKISGLLFDGVISGNGQITGNSETATFFIHLKGQNFNFENLQLNSIKTKLTYAHGILKFDPTEITLPEGSSINTFLEINLNQQNLMLTSKSTVLKALDLSYLLEKHLNLGWIKEGSGPCEIYINGPLYWRNWDIATNCSFSKILSLNEYIDLVKIQFSIKNSILNVGETFIQKGNHRLFFKGYGNMKEDAIISFHLDKIPLYILNNVSFLNAMVNGFFELEGKIERPYSNYRITSFGKFTELEIHGKKMAPIIVETHLSEAEKTFQINILDNSFQLDLQFASNNINKIFFKSDHFDPKIFLPLINSSKLIDSIKTNFTGEFNFEYSNKEPYQGSGYLKIVDIFFSGLGIDIKLDKEKIIYFRNGEFDKESIVLKGLKNQLLDLSLFGNLENLGLKMVFDLESQLFQPILPFLDSLQGRILGQLQIDNMFNDFDSSGTILINNNTIQIENLPQPITFFNARIELQNRNLIISSSSAQFAQGNISASGKVIFEKFGEMKVDIPITFANLAFIPMDGVQLNTHGNMTIKGNWFPYVLMGNITVENGLMTKDIEATESSQIRKSSLLPRILLREASDPLMLLVSLSLKSLNIRNNLMEGTAKGQLVIKDSPRNPKLLGHIEVNKGSKIQYREQEFLIQQGQIFLSDREDFDPQLYFLAEARIDKYDIALNVQGNLSKPQVRLSSQPMLSESDILSLIAFGQLPHHVEGNIQRPTSESNAQAQLGSALLQNIGLFKKAQRAVGVNVNISSGYDPDHNTEFRRISIAKRLGQNARVTATTGDFGFREFKFEYRLSDRLLAISRMRQQDFIPNSTALERQNRSDSILGIDLEYRQEFK
ncbi:MAG: translocation/assembly module TamB [Bdellovibrionaceae bacterium]|nr:translocation/assembly module TamB [Pseudobdellovibrionaceae bacterium]MDW8190603.1 translocation/assembly module TamB domain-containing protein [Pseudobdellovibrionaceae bacterium]